MTKFSTLLEAVLNGKSLTAAEMSAVMDEVMAGKLTDAQLAAFLIALRSKGETADELAAAAMTVRKFAVSATTHLTDLVDTCGTGGDGLGTFNISTAAAIVAAATGVSIAKHGNRSVSSNSGSADFLEEVGVDLTLNAAQVALCIEQIGIGFLFAPQFHKAMKLAAPVRQQIGVRTMFNLLGPLTNPLHAKTQLIGVCDAHWLEPIAHAAKQLGVQRAMVVCGEDGMDEISINAPTQVVELNEGKVHSWRIEPTDFNIRQAELAAITVTDAVASRAMIESVFKGEKGAPRDIVAINAAAVIYLSGKAPDLSQAIALAYATIDAGGAADQLQKLVRTTQKLARNINQPRARSKILTQILAHKQAEVAERKQRHSASELREWMAEKEAPRGFQRALESKVTQNKPTIIAEIKRASPSKGILREDFDPLSIARSYMMAGADCLSVLTDNKFFKGSGVVLDLVHKHCPLPILRKDFIIDEYQIYESRAFGADCILLIVAAISGSQLQDLFHCAREQGMDVLVEVHNAAELEEALRLGDALQMIGINNRDLHTFNVTLQTTLDLVEQIPDNKLIISESGIRTRADILQLIDVGVYAYLIGESLITANDPGVQLKALLETYTR